MKAFRVVVVLAAAATTLTTWPLWSVRESPPMLPLVPLPQLDLGPLLLLALAVALARPAVGATAYTVLITYAVLIDQMRLQPQFMSFALLLVATLPGDTGRTIGRIHLITLWGWAGLNKLLSPEFLSTAGPDLAAVAMPAAPAWLAASSGYALGVTEVALAGLALVPSFRRVASIVALLLHVWILIVLFRQDDPNWAIWPWNATIALSGLAFIAPWQEQPRVAWHASAPYVRAIALLLAISPAGFHFGLVDAYLSHNLYTANTANASIEPRTKQRLGVPFPPAHRLYEQYFQATCLGGETLQIVDVRPWLQRRGLSRRDIPCDLQVAPPRSPR